MKTTGRTWAGGFVVMLALCVGVFAYSAEKNKPRSAKPATPQELYQLYLRLVHFGMPEPMNMKFDNEGTGKHRVNVIEFDLNDVHVRMTHSGPDLDILPGKTNPVEPQFKVGDKVFLKDGPPGTYKVVRINLDGRLVLYRKDAAEVTAHSYEVGKLSEGIAD